MLVRDSQYIVEDATDSQVCDFVGKCSCVSAIAQTLFGDSYIHVLVDKV